MIERDISIQEAEKGYREFRNFVRSSFNKQLLLTTLDNAVTSKDWPLQYYSLREQILPFIIGEDASKFFFWFVLSDGEDDFEPKKEDQSLLHFILLNYTDKFLLAKQFNANPLGFGDINFTTAQDNNYFNTYIKRNDEESFMLRNSIMELSVMLEACYEYLAEMIINDAINYTEDIEPLKELISTTHESLELIQNKINEGEIHDES